MSNASSAAAVGASGGAGPSPQEAKGGEGASLTPAPLRLSARKRNPAAASSRISIATDNERAANVVLRSTSREPAAVPAQDDLQPRTLDLINDPLRTDLKISTKSTVDANTSHGESQAYKAKLLKLFLQAKAPRSTRLAAAFTRRFFSLGFVLFVIVVGTASTFWNWRPPEPSILSASMEGQVAELQETLKKTTKMMQVQLDLIDMKMQKEVDNLRKELKERLEDQAFSFGTELRNIETKTENIESSLRKLTESGFPTQQDVLNLISSVVQERAKENSREAFSLDDVRSVARRLVEVELERHAADGIGKVDYALASGGGKVVAHSESLYNGLGMGIRLLTGRLLRVSNKHPFANKMLEPSFGEPGKCLPLKGSNVYVEISLRTSIFPEAFSLEHVSKSVAYDISSAPKEFRVFGWLHTFQKPLGRSATQVLGEFIYSTDKPSVQTFVVPEDLRGKLINMVRLEVLTNYGSPSHTCIYRFRVHGFDPHAPPPQLA